MSKTGSVAAAGLAAVILGVFVLIGKALAGRVHQWRVTVGYPDGSADVRVFGFNNRTGADRWGATMAARVAGAVYGVNDTDEPVTVDDGSQ